MAHPRMAPAPSPASRHALRGAGGTVLGLRGGHAADGLDAASRRVQRPAPRGRHAATPGPYALHAKALSGGKEGTRAGPRRRSASSCPPTSGPCSGAASGCTCRRRPMSHAGSSTRAIPRPGHRRRGHASTTLDWYEVATYQQKYMASGTRPSRRASRGVQVSGTPLVPRPGPASSGSSTRQRPHAEAATPRVWLDGVELGWPEQFVFSDRPPRAAGAREGHRLHGAGDRHRPLPGPHGVHRLVAGRPGRRQAAARLRPGLKRDFSPAAPPAGAGARRRWSPPPRWTSR